MKITLGVDKGYNEHSLPLTDAQYIELLKARKVDYVMSGDDTKVSKFKEHGLDVFLDVSIYNISNLAEVLSKINVERVNITIINRISWSLEKEDQLCDQLLKLKSLNRQMDIYILFPDAKWYIKTNYEKYKGLAYFSIPICENKFVTGGATPYETIRSIRDMEDYIPILKNFKKVHLVFYGSKGLGTGTYTRKFLKEIIDHLVENSIEHVTATFCNISFDGLGYYMDLDTKNLSCYVNVTMVRNISLSLERTPCSDS